MLDATRSKVSKPQSAKSKKSKPSISKIIAAKPASAIPAKSNQATKRARTSKPADASLSTLTTTTTTTSPSLPSPPTTNPTMPTPPPPQPSDSLPLPLPQLRDLASSTPLLRRAALASVLTHLESSRPATTPPTPTQAQQLWRALYVSLYMHDSKSSISVQNHARALASTLRVAWARDREAGVSGDGGGGKGGDGDDEGMWTWSRTWAEAFWGEMTREWIGVDQWRMNKVLMLVRMLVAEGVVCAVESAALAAAPEEGGDERGDGCWRDYVVEVVALPLEVQRSLPDGLRMHVLDVWGDELEKLVGGGEEDEGEKEDGADEHAGTKREVADMLVQAAKELSVFRQGEVNVPKNVRARAKEIVQSYSAQ